MRQKEFAHVEPKCRDIGRRWYAGSTRTLYPSLYTLTVYKKDLSASAILFKYLTVYARTRVNVYAQTREIGAFLCIKAFTTGLSRLLHFHKVFTLFVTTLCPQKVSQKFLCYNFIKKTVHKFPLNLASSSICAE